MYNKYARILVLLSTNETAKVELDAATNYTRAINTAYK